MTRTADAQIFDSRALAKFTVVAIAVCMIFDFAYGFIFSGFMIMALPLEIAALLFWTYFLGWWSNSFRYTMKTAGLVLSFVLPNLAMGLLVVALMSFEIAVKGWQ